jgi:hypothetical protein
MFKPTKRTTTYGRLSLGPARLRRAMATLTRAAAAVVVAVRCFQVYISKGSCQNWSERYQIRSRNGG